MYSSIAAAAVFLDQITKFLVVQNISEGASVEGIRGVFRLTYIENNYMHRLTLSSISANVNLSTSYLCRVFKSEVGTSITSYLNNLRIRKAATLIKENTFSLKEISVMVGIDDQLYFSRLFKKCMGISPSEYGKRFHL